MDVLALIAAEPAALPLWVVFCVAAGMYPVGMLFGCSPCCVPCGESCETGTLPDTLTVTLDGFTDKTKAQLCSLNFSSCYGGGATGIVTAPGGDPDTDKGPITAVSLFEHGSGYAKKGRTEPTVSAAPLETSNGNGLTLTVTLEQYLNGCKVDEWKVTKVSGNGGTGFVDEEVVHFTVASGDTEETPAAARIRTVRAEPNLTLAVDSVDGGTGASLTAVLEQVDGTPARWRIDSVTVEDGGDGYAYIDTVLITPDENSKVVFDATLRVEAAHVEPTVEASVITTAGTGALLGVTLTTTAPDLYPDVTVWKVESIAVLQGGSGYNLYDAIQVLVVDGSSSGSPASGYVDGIDENGSIVSIALTGFGEYFKGGPITGIAVQYGGLYWRDTGEAEKVEVDNGGVYYREDETLDPYVATVEVSVAQTDPSSGTGAVITATVDDDPASETFGQINSLSIDSSGDGYLAWRWVPNACCGHQLNGKTFVLQRDIVPHARGKNGAQVLIGGLGGKFVPAECVWSHRMCGGYCPPFSSGYFDNIPKVGKQAIAVGYRGPSLPPIAGVSRLEQSWSSDDCGETPCATFFEAEGPISDCSEFSFSAQSASGQTISVSPGGSYDYTNGIAEASLLSCNVCCQGDELAPEEIEVQVHDVMVNRPGIPADTFGLPGGGIVAMPNVSGTYVLSGPGRWFWLGGIINAIQFGLSITPTPCQYSPCESCIKKCRVGASVGLWFTDSYWFYDANDSCEAQWGGQGCQPCHRCEPTPVCRPQPGRVFHIRWVPKFTLPQNVAAVSKPAFIITVN